MFLFFLIWLHVIAVNILYRVKVLNYISVYLIKLYTAFIINV